MTALIEHIAELTAFRDRDALDVSVVRAIGTALRPLHASIYRSVGEPGAQHWLTRARLRAGAVAITADPPWTELSSLPALDDVPARSRCLKHAEVVCVGESPQVCSFPISTEREVVGVLELETPAPLAATDRTMVCTILRIYGNVHDLLDHSERDPLTGLLNRQTFDSAFTAQPRRPPVAARVLPAEADADRRGDAAPAAVWLGVIDIDHFKRVNDTFGHPIGDEVLLLLSRLLRASFRHHDRLYRFGGEEFVVVLDGLRADQAAQAFERLRANVERFAFPQVGHVTVSIGFASTQPEEPPATTYSRADKALYHAKEHGRNQIVSFDDLVRAGLTVPAAVTGDIELF